MDGELKPTYIPSWHWGPNLECWGGTMRIWTTQPKICKCETFG